MQSNRFFCLAFLIPQAVSTTAARITTAATGNVTALRPEEDISRTAWDATVEAQ